MEHEDKIFSIDIFTDEIYLYQNDLDEFFNQDFSALTIIHLIFKVTKDKVTINLKDTLNSYEILKNQKMKFGVFYQYRNNIKLNYEEIK